MNAEKARQRKPESQILKYTPKDAIIYALSVGATPVNDLHFVYEGHENFQVLPTYVVAPGLTINNIYINQWPGIPMNWTKVLHGEQYIEVFEPLSSSGGEVRADMKIVDVLDKGSGALIISEVTLYDNKTNCKQSVMQFAIYQVGAGNFGGPKSTAHERKVVNVPTNTSPEKVLEVAIREEQAAIYRQAGGDLNPLHIDPEFAKAAGFEKPIFHGLGTLGVVTKKILEAYGANDTANFKAVKTRFSAPVLPGQTLLIETWQNENRIHFQAKTKETGKVVLASSYMDLHKIGSAASMGNGKVSATQNIKSAEIFERIGDELSVNKNTVAKINAIIVYDITVDGKLAASYTLDLKNQPFSVYNGKPKNGEKENVLLTVNDDDFVQLAAGKLDGIKAFMSGRLKIRGNVMLMQKLQQILAKARTNSKL